MRLGTMAANQSIGLIVMNRDRMNAIRMVVSTKQVANM